MHSNLQQKKKKRDRKCNPRALGSGDAILLKVVQYLNLKGIK